MNLINRVLGSNKFIVLVKPEQGSHIRMDLINNETKTYFVKTRSKVSAIEKIAFKYYGRKDAIAYRFRVYDENEYIQFAKEKLEQDAINTQLNLHTIPS